jgi:hypothetical protein
MKLRDDVSTGSGSDRVVAKLDLAWVTRSLPLPVLTA